MISNPGAAGEGHHKRDRKYHWKLWQPRQRRRKTTSKKAVGFKSKTATLQAITLNDTFLCSQTDYDLKFSHATFHGGLEQRTTNSPFLSFYLNLTN